MRVRREHHLGRDEIRQRAEEVADELATKYNLRYEWHGDDLKFHGSGVKGKIEVRETTIDIDVRLGFALMMLESTIKTTIEKTLDEHLA